MNREALWTNGYDYEVALDCNQALALAAVRQVGAIVVARADDAAKLIERWKRITPATTIVLFNSSNARLSMGGRDNLVVDTVSNIQSLLQLLHRRLIYKRNIPLPTPRYQHIQLQWPLSILADRDGELICVGGLTLSISEAGLWARVVKEFIPGETVLIGCNNAPEDPFLRAEVRYRSGDVYGFVFHKGYLNG